MIGDYMAKGNNLPVMFEVKAGSLNFFAGRYKGKTLVSWDIVGSCNGEDCPAYAKCTFALKDERRDKCIVQLKYIKAAAHTFYKNYAEVLSPMQLYGFGMHVTPLIAQLIKLKLVEVGVGVEDIVVHGKSMYIHPVFKEVREIIKSIYATCKELGIDPNNLNELTEKANIKNGDIFDIAEEDYVSELIGETDPANSPQSFNFKSPSKA